LTSESFLYFVDIYFNCSRYVPIRSVDKQWMVLPTLPILNSGRKVLT
jgi:hypothetical protein